MRYLVTGGAGFIGSHLVDALLARGEQVVCLDNFNDYYSPARKRRNIANALEQPGYTLVEADFREPAALEHVFTTHRPQRIAHLGAMANARYSVHHAPLYVQTNVAGTVALLELARKYGVENFLLASTSSVYGSSPTPWHEELSADRPLSPYAASKRSAELHAFTYAHLYGLPTTVVRLFTVYGPRGRPDMTPYLFVHNMVRGKPFTLFNGGENLYRDYTYVSDIVAGVVAALDAVLPFEIINLGNERPILMQQFVRLLEQITGHKALIDSVPMPTTEPPITFADTTKAQRLLGYRPQTNVEQGLSHFWQWYCKEEMQNDR